MRKRLTVSILAVAVALLVITSFFLLENKFPAFKTGDNAWKLNLENFATAVAFDSGKVFVTDNPCDLICLDASSGNVIWTANVGGWTSNAHLLTVSKSIVYVGAAGGVVDTLSETSGKLLPMSFAAPVTTSWGQKQSPQQFFVSEGRIFVSQNGWAVFNVSNGELFWESGELGLQFATQVTRQQILIRSLFNGQFVLTQIMEVLFGKLEAMPVTLQSLFKAK